MAGMNIVLTCYILNKFLSSAIDNHIATYFFPSFFVRDDCVNACLMSLQQLLYFCSRVSLGSASPVTALVVFHYVNSSIAFCKWHQVMFCMGLNELIFARCSLYLIFFQCIHFFFSFYPQPVDVIFSDAGTNSLGIVFQIISLHKLVFREVVHRIGNKQHLD